MDVELQVNNSAAPEARYVSWAPASCRVRVTNPTGATSPVNLTITGVSAASGGAVVFRRSTTGSFSNSLTLSVPITAPRFRSLSRAGSGDPASRTAT